MPEYFKTQLRDGTAQVAESLALPSAALVRGHGERRARRRRIGAVSATVSAALVVGGVAFGVARQDSPHATRPSVAAAVSNAPTNSAHTGPSAVGTTSSGTGGSVGVHLSPPAQYAAATENKVGLTIDNSGPARQVVVEFKSTQTNALYWVEPCDSSVGGGCNKNAYADNPLKVAKGAESEVPGVAAFDLALPAGTSSYTAWVGLPAGVTSYTVLVLEGTTVLGQSSSGPINHGFPTLSAVGQGTVTIVRGGSAVEFDTKITDNTSASYVDLFSFTTLSCKAGQSTVTLPQGSYTLKWGTGADWQSVGPVKALGQFSYELSPGQSTTTRFRLALSSSLPSDVTSCQVTQVASASDTWTAPYYDRSAPNARIVVDFDVR